MSRLGTIGRTALKIKGTLQNAYHYFSSKGETCKTSKSSNTLLNINIRNDERLVLDGRRQNIETTYALQIISTTLQKPIFWSISIIYNPTLIKIYRNQSSFTTRQLSYS